jgi:hypothetical protein
MAVNTTTEIYLIDSTDKSKQFAIQPRTLDGAGGIQRNSTLSLPGNALPRWGERYNENVYRITENFACRQRNSGDADYIPNEIWPASETSLNESGLGINEPLQGQLWFNKTDNRLYFYDSRVPKWKVASGIKSGLFVDRPLTGNVIGDLYYATDIPQLYIWNGLAWESVADRYVLKTGDTMSGTLIMDAGSSGFPNGDAITIRGQTATGIRIYSQTAGTFGDTQPPALMLYNPDNDPNEFPVEVPTDHRPFLRLSTRDNSYFTFEADTLDTLAASGIVVLESSQNTGVMTYRGNPSIANGNTVRTPNASIAAVGSDPKNLITLEYLNNAFGNLDDYVLKAGDTMSGPLVIDASPSLNFPNTSGLEVRSDGGPSIRLFTTSDNGVPPALAFYNADNDPVNFPTASNADWYPYMRLNNRDGSFFNIEIDRDDVGSGIGPNTRTLINANQETGILFYNGNAPETTENVIRVNNASITAIGANAKNLITKEYFDFRTGTTTPFDVDNFMLNTGDDVTGYYIMRDGGGAAGEILALIGNTTSVLRLTTTVSAASGWPRVAFDNIDNSALHRPRTVIGTPNGSLFTIAYNDLTSSLTTQIGFEIRQDNGETVIWGAGDSLAKIDVRDGDVRAPKASVTLPDHLTTKSYVDGLVGGGVGNFVLKTGDTMTGNLQINRPGGSTLVLNPPSGASTIELGSFTVPANSLIDFRTSGTGNDYDSRIIAAGGTSTLGNGDIFIRSGNIYLQPTGRTFANNNRISDLEDPILDQDAATKFYVDNIPTGVNFVAISGTATGSLTGVPLPTPTGITVNWQKAAWVVANNSWNYPGGGAASKVISVYSNVLWTGAALTPPTVISYQREIYDNNRTIRTRNRIVSFNYLIIMWE